MYIQVINVIICNGKLHKNVYIYIYNLNLYEIL